MATYNTLKDALKAFETDVVAKIHPTKADLKVATDEIATKASSADVYTKTEVDTKIADVVTNGSVDLGNYYTKSESDELLSGKAELNHIHDGYALKEHTHDEYLTEHQDISGKADRSELFSKDYNDLTNKPEIPEAYDDSELRNLINSKAESVHSHEEYALAEHTHDEYLTEHQSLADYAKTSYVDEKVQAVIAEELDSNPEAYNTLKELNKALREHEDAYDALLETIGGKAEKTDLNNYYTKEEADGKFLTDQNISGKADKSYVDEELAKKAAHDHTHESYITIDILNDALESEDYATNSSVDALTNQLATKVSSEDLKGYATKEYVDQQDRSLEALIKALNVNPDSPGDPQIPDLTGFATKADLESKVNISDFQLSDAQIAEILTNTK